MTTRAHVDGRAFETISGAKTQDTQQKRTVVVVIVIVVIDIVSISIRIGKDGSSRIAIAGHPRGLEILPQDAQVGLLFDDVL